MLSSDRSLAQGVSPAAAFVWFLRLPLASACTVQAALLQPASDTRAGRRRQRDLSSIADQAGRAALRPGGPQPPDLPVQWRRGPAGCLGLTLTLVAPRCTNRPPGAGRRRQRADRRHGNADRRYVLTGSTTGGAGRRQRPPPDRVVLRRAAPGIRGLPRPARRAKTAPRANSPSCSTWPIAQDLSTV